jgi:hypothetical protein
LWSATEAVELSQVPDELGAAIRQASFSDERPRRIGAVDLEAIVALNAVRQPDVVEDGAECDDFVVALHRLCLPDLHREEPRAHRVVEEVGRRKPLRVLDRIGDKRRVGRAHPGN